MRRTIGRSSQLPVGLVLLVVLVVKIVISGTDAQLDNSSTTSQAPTIMLQSISGVLAVIRSQKKHEMEDRFESKSSESNNTTPMTIRKREEWLIASPRELPEVGTVKKHEGNIPRIDAFESPFSPLLNMIMEIIVKNGDQITGWENGEMFPILIDETFSIFPYTFDSNPSPFIKTLRERNVETDICDERADDKYKQFLDEIVQLASNVLTEALEVLEKSGENGTFWFQNITEVDENLWKRQELKLLTIKIKKFLEAFDTHFRPHFLAPGHYKRKKRYYGGLMRKLKEFETTVRGLKEDMEKAKSDVQKKVSEVVAKKGNVKPEVEADVHVTRRPTGHSRRRRDIMKPKEEISTVLFLEKIPVTGAKIEKTKLWIRKWDPTKRNDVRIRKKRSPMLNDVDIIRTRNVEEDGNILEVTSLTNGSNNTHLKSGNKSEEVEVNGRELNKNQVEPTVPTKTATKHDDAVTKKEQKVPAETPSPWRVNLNRKETDMINDARANFNLEDGNVRTKGVSLKEAEMFDRIWKVHILDGNDFDDPVKRKEMLEVLRNRKLHSLHGRAEGIDAEILKKEGIGHEAKPEHKSVTNLSDMLLKVTLPTFFSILLLISVLCICFRPRGAICRKVFEPRKELRDNKIETDIEGARLTENSSDTEKRKRY